MVGEWEMMAYLCFIEIGYEACLRTVFVVMLLDCFYWVIFEFLLMLRA